MDKKLYSEIKAIYSAVKPDIEKRLCEFIETREKMSRDELFYELGFCLLTPQSKATSCWDSICSIKKNMKKKHKSSEILLHIKKVRFMNNKAKYFEDAQKKWNNGLFDEMVCLKDVFKMREFLVTNVKGIGYKEASHFLRNIGLGENLAILDRHILKNLKLLGIIDEVPKSLTKKSYQEIEESMAQFSRASRIPLSHLDFVLWYKEAGRIFK
ncbi:MAG: N-glycosylase/DNA lyase [bacterium]|nr:N-glycosylase/DNA lyase [bacterium]